MLTGKLEDLPHSVTTACGPAGVVKLPSPKHAQAAVDFRHLLICEALLMSVDKNKALR